MTPRKIFLFGLCVTVAIVAVAVVFPGGWTAGTLTLHYPDYRTWFKHDTTRRSDIQAIIASIDTSESDLEPAELYAGDDSLQADRDAVKTVADSLQLSATAADDVYAVTQPLEFPQGQDTLLFPLFRSLDRAKRRDRPVRILHYGDSQIEGDRITAAIRNHMQKNYGGQGIGFIPVTPANDVSVTFQQDISPNWRRFSVLNRDNAGFNRFGIAGNLARYIPSGREDTTAHIGLAPLYIGYRNVRTFTGARLFYGPSENPFDIIVNHADTQRMPVRNTLSSAWWRFAAPQNSLDLILKASSLPDMYGIALDGIGGVAVDNLPLRGSSGLDFTRMDTAQMGQMFRMMDVEMLILQFGANVIPNVVNSYDYYMRKFAQELRMLKALKPGLTIVVIGVSDMSQNSSDGYKSYPNIEKVRDAQKKAAFEAGCAFWDLYAAMGGENSMSGWAFADPPLAQKDFIHFTVDGARIVAELFCRAWSREYRRFGKQ